MVLTLWAISFAIAAIGVMLIGAPARADRPMSVPDVPPSRTLPAARADVHRASAMFSTAFLVVFGIALLLPGLCSLVFMGMIGGTAGEFILPSLGDLPPDRRRSI